MSGNLRKTISLVVLVCMLTLSTGMVFAQSDEKLASKSVQTISEYDSIKSLQALTDEELKGKGLSEDDITELRKIDLSNFLKELKTSSDTELKELGLSSEKISMVRSSKDEATILRATMGKVSYYVQPIELEYKKGVSYLKVNAHWEWSSVPLQTMIDIFAISTNENFFLIGNAEYNNAIIKYYKNGNKSSTQKEVETSIKTEGAGKQPFIRITLVKAYPSSTSERDDKYYAMKGTLNVRMKISGKINTVNTACKYGHAILTCTPSISTDGQGISIGFTPKYMIDSGLEDTAEINLT